MRGRGDLRRGYALLSSLFPNAPKSEVHGPSREARYTISIKEWMAAAGGDGEDTSTSIKHPKLNDGLMAEGGGCFGTDGYQ